MCMTSFILLARDRHVNNINNNEEYYKSKYIATCLSIDRCHHTNPISRDLSYRYMLHLSTFSELGEDDLACLPDTTLLEM
jgi:hypothetical protein